MDWSLQEWIKNIITLGSIFAAILAWIAKLRWSKEYSNAKDAVISAKQEQVKIKQTHIEYLERQIVSLKEFTPQKLREHYKSIQEQLEELISKLEKDLAKSKSELAMKDQELAESSYREENLKENIRSKEEQLQQAKNELAKVTILRASANRLVISPPILYKDIEDIESTESFVGSEDYLTPPPTDPSVENMVEWFFENFKDPADGVPYEEGEYIYVFGGPYDAEDQLTKYFPDADEEDIQKAVKEIESEGQINWVKKWEY